MVNIHSTDTEGIFISFEGIDGAGKSTQVNRLEEAFKAQGREVVRVREPGGTFISEKIRELLLDPENHEMVWECEMLLYEASRAQLTRQTIIPALERGAVVLCDRYYDSTYSYQAGARGLDKDLVNELNRIGSLGCTPDITFLFDLDVETAANRVLKSGKLDRLEAEGIAFMQKVRDAYLELEQKEDRIHKLDSTQSPDQIYADIEAVFARLGVEV